MPIIKRTKSKILRTMRVVFFTIALIPITSYAYIDHKIVKSINKYCVGVKKSIVLGIIKTESNFRNTINRGTSNPSVGVMQIKVPTARQMKCRARSVKDLLVVWKNIQCGCKYLQYQIEEHGEDYNRVVAAYNAGDVYVCKRNSSVCRKGSIINQSYVNIVMHNAQIYQGVL